jgi:hypothetical protein
MAEFNWRTLDSVRDGHSRATEMSLTVNTFWLGFRDGEEDAGTQGVPTPRHELILVTCLHRYDGKNVFVCDLDHGGAKRPTTASSL